MVSKVLIKISLSIYYYVLYLSHSCSTAIYPCLWCQLFEAANTSNLQHNPGRRQKCHLVPRRTRGFCPWFNIDWVRVSYEEYYCNVASIFPCLCFCCCCNDLLLKEINKQCPVAYYLRKLAPLRWVVAVPNISGDIWLGEDVRNMLTFKYLNGRSCRHEFPFVHSLTYTKVKTFEIIICSYQ